MVESDADLTVRVWRRARRAMLAGLEALNALPLSTRKSVAGLGANSIHRALALGVLRFFVIKLGRARGLFAVDSDFSHGRLFSTEREGLLDVQPRIAGARVDWLFSATLASAESSFSSELTQGLESDGLDFESCPAELVGNLYELLLGEAVSVTPEPSFELAFGTRRKQTGTFFTPRALTRIVVERALEACERRQPEGVDGAPRGELRVLDPSVGAGAFLVELARALGKRAPGESAAFRRALVSRVLHGVDIDPIAVAVAEAVLFLYVSDPQLALHEAGYNLRVGDALIGAPDGHGSAALGADSYEDRHAFDFVAEFPDVFALGGFDLVIGNPPWVAYAGRAAKPLDPARKKYLAARYTTLKGYPTLHGLFVERALRLSPNGTLALVVPSPIADLQGYRAVRRAVRRSHTPCEPMLEFGQDAFESVTQPCFALIAEAHGGAPRTNAADDAPFRLAERQRAGGVAAEVSAPASLLALAGFPTLPREMFGEMGFQTSARVSRELLRRAGAPDASHHYPLLEGRDVHAFREGEPHLYLAPDPAILSATRCRLRDRSDYARVSFVVRQTARYPIAAVHRGLPFRNSLLAGFTVDGFSPELAVGLLNSSLYRAWHLACQRDARQAAFPQVKIAHLRSLPAPPVDLAGRARVAQLSTELGMHGVTPNLSERLDAAVFELFALEKSAARDIQEFLIARSAPRR